LDGPNIVIVHWHDLGTYLPTYGFHARSPNTDSLARESAVFTRCFSVSPLCSPARGALWTGRYPHSNGLQGLVHRGWEYDEGERTLPMYLGEAGYRTALVGLQHEAGDVTRLGFDEVLGTTPSRADDVGSTAADWLSDHADDDDPFLLVCGTTEVHRDWSPDRYPSSVSFDDVVVPPYLPDNELTRRDLAAFAAAIEAADRGLGRIMEALTENGLDSSTIVMFTTDHGPPFPGAKSTLHDPGVQVALMIRMPSTSTTRQPAFESGLVSHVDLVPTILDLLHLPLPEQVQGESIARNLTDGTPVRRREVYLEKTYHADYDPVRAVRTDSYKYIRSFEDRPVLALPPDLENSLTRQGMGDAHLAPRPREELYDLRSDPGETVNLIDELAHADAARTLRGRLHEFMASTGDALLGGPVPPPDPARRQP
jgi:arylsulfatase A-like enzyme